MISFYCDTSKDFNAFFLMILSDSYRPVIIIFRFLGARVYS